jgi:N-acetylneuraminate synthase
VNVADDAIFVIAEAGVNHNGDEGRALTMIDVAADCGADAVKFQTFSAAELVTADAPKAAYQSRATGNGGQYEMLKALEMSPAMHEALFARCEARGIAFLSTPFDLAAARFLVDLGMSRIKIPSGELTHKPFLEGLARLGPALILSTGMGTLAEVREAVGWIEVAAGEDWPMRGPDRLTILHCVSNYPAEPDEVNLRAMDTIREAMEYPVGYSDHTAGIAVSIAAAARGARVIEKHFTLDCTLPGPDHAASLEPDSLAAMIAAIRTVECALGSPEKIPSASERETRKAARRSLVLARAVVAGERLDADALTIRRPGTGLAPKRFEEVAGRTVARDLPAGHVLGESDLA